MRQHTQGLTLVEVLFVIAIVGVLSVLLLGLLLPWLTSPGTPSSVKVCMSNLSQLAKAMITYQEPNGDFFPAYWDGSAFQPTMSMALLYPQYIDNYKVFHCPSDAFSKPPLIASRQSANGIHLDFGPIDGDERSSYFYDELSHFRKVGPRQAMACDADGQAWKNEKDELSPYPPDWKRTPRRPNHPNGQNVMYFDGSVKWQQTNYASDEPNDNIFCAERGWGADTDAFLWDGSYRRVAE